MTKNSKEYINSCRNLFGVNDDDEEPSELLMTRIMSTETSKILN
ncbi:hypothetical protein [Candidatus Nitrosocosmicus sp. SS]|jgi:hypothetical protein|nr:hypothetical protein [Candidatus Nitrosocosmicus sp. SS]